LPEERLDQIYNMVTELIRMLGSTSYTIEELRKDKKEIKQRQEQIEARLDRLEALIMDMRLYI